MRLIIELLDPIKGQIQSFKSYQSWKQNKKNKKNDRIPK